MKRLEKLEQSLVPTQKECVLIGQWGDDPEDVREDKLARWRAGEDIEGAPANIEDRENAHVILIVGLLPPSEVSP